MPVTINGNGSISGLSVGGLGSGVVNTATLASGAITSSTLPSGSIIQVVNTTLNTTATISITNQYSNNSSNIYYVTGIDTTICLLYTSPSPRDKRQSRMPSSA